MGQRTQILLQVIDNKGNVKNKLYYYQWGFGKTMPAMFMRLVIEDSYLKNTFAKDFDFCEFIKMGGWDISDELNESDIKTFIPLDSMSALERILEGHDNNNGFMVIQAKQGVKSYETTFKIGFLKGFEETDDLFKGYISPREYMEQFPDVCDNDFINCFESFCKVFEIETL